MRLPNDEKMAQSNNSDVVDLIFGGHDHCYEISLNHDTNVFITKSGTDFECFTNLTVLDGVEKNDYLKFKEKVDQELKREDRCDLMKSNEYVFQYSEALKRVYIAERVNITEMFWSDGEVYSHVKDHADKINFKLDKVALSTEVKLEARFSRIRTEETTAGNLVADLMRS